MKFITINLSLVFLSLIYEIIHFDEEFLVTFTIFVSFSQLLKLLFNSLNNNFVIFKNSLLNIYLFLIKSRILFIKYSYLTIVNIESVLNFLGMIINNIWNIIFSNNLFFIKDLYLIINLITNLFLNFLKKKEFSTEKIKNWFIHIYNINDKITSFIAFNLNYPFKNIIKVFDKIKSIDYNFHKSDLKKPKIVKQKNKKAAGVTGLEPAIFGSTSQHFNH